MRLLAVDSEHDYFLLGCSIEEVNKKIIPQQNNLLDRYKGDGHKTYYVSSPETREAELKAQAKIKANPYQSKTRLFGILIHEEPTYDAFVVVRRDLTELYFVPFDFFFPEKWGNHNPWGNTVKKDIKSLIEVTKLPMINEKGDPYSGPESWTNGDAEALLADYQEEMTEWKKKGPRFVYNIVMAQFQLYRLSHLEIEMLLSQGGVSLPKEWYEMDSAHRHIALDYLKKKTPEEALEDLGLRRFKTTEEERARLQEMEEQGFTEGAIIKEFYGDYLDGCFTWETFMDCVPEDDRDRYDDLQGLDDDERRRRLWRATTGVEDY